MCSSSVCWNNFRDFFVPFQADSCQDAKEERRLGDKKVSSKKSKRTLFSGVIKTPILGNQPMQMYGIFLGIYPK